MPFTPSVFVFSSQPADAMTASSGPTAAMVVTYGTAEGVTSRAPHDTM